MRDLTQHLTTRADDSRAPPVLRLSEEHFLLSQKFLRCQALVRFFALLRIKPHVPPLVRVPVNSFEFHTCVRTPQAGFATPAFVPQCQLRPSKALSPPMFLPISTHFTATPGIPFTSTAFQPASIRCRTEVELRALTPDLTNHLRTLYAQ